MQANGKSRFEKNLTIFFSLTALLFLLVLFFIFLDLLHYSEQPAESEPVEKFITVDQGKASSPGI
jgi:uncharacterized protein YpmS